MKSNIRKLGFFLLAMLTVLIIYLSYLQIYKGPELASHPQNRRLIEEVGKIQRGTIYDQRGTVIAESNWDEQKWRRHYLMPEQFAHIVGYSTEKYGSSGLEAAYNKQLLGLEGGAKAHNMWRQLLGKERVGEDLVLTIDANLQRLAYQLLANQGQAGSVVAINPSTGAIMAAVSYPSFNANNLQQQWPELVDNEKAPLLNRSFQGAYPPGSIMKVITLAGALSAGIDQNKTYQCPGYLKDKKVYLKDNQTHGQINLTEAMVVSCNTTYGSLALEMGSAHFVDTANKFGFGKRLGLSLPVRDSTINNKGSINRQSLVESAIGQGEILVSPLHMALVAATVANDGVLMEPYLVQEIIDTTAKPTFKHQPTSIQEATIPSHAHFIRDAMVNVVERGTGKAARINGVPVAGKTGTAENIQGAPHAWFIGFAPASQPRIAVAVVVENSGAGSTIAAPIAQQLILEALR